MRTRPGSVTDTDTDPALMRTAAVTEYMDFTWSYVTDYLQNAESLTVFEDFVV